MTNEQLEIKLKSGELSEHAIAVATQCWCDPRVANRTMDAELALVFAEKLTKLENELETERMRLAACGVVAMSNTTTTLDEALKMSPNYYCASVRDVERAVRSEIQYREALKCISKENHAPDCDVHHLTHGERAGDCTCFKRNIPDSITGLT